QFTPWVLPMALVGLVAGFFRHRRETILLSACAAVIAFGAILVPNFLLESQWIWLNTTYWIPVYVVTAVLLALGITALPRWWMSAAVAGIAVASPFAMHRHHNDLSDYRFARDYGENLLRTMRPDAVYFGTGDHTLFPL